MLKWFKILLTLILVVVMMMGACAKSKIQTTTTVTQATSTTQPTSTTTQATSNTAQTTSASSSPSASTTVAVSPPKLDFSAKIYTDLMNNFSFSYDASWAQSTTFARGLNWVIEFQPIGSYQAVGVIRYPQAVRDSVEDIWNRTWGSLSTNGGTISSRTTSSNSYGLNAEVIEGQYNSVNSGTGFLTVRAYGFKANGTWWIMYMVQDFSKGDLNGGGTAKIYADEIFATWHFTK